MESLPAKCKLCPFVGNVGDVLRHIEVCPEVNIGCPNRHCTVPVLRRDSVAHSRECPFEIITCILCKKDMFRNEEEAAQAVQQGENLAVEMKLGQSKFSAFLCTPLSTGPSKAGGGGLQPGHNLLKFVDL